MKSTNFGEAAQQCSRLLDQDNELFVVDTVTRNIEWDGETLKSAKTDNDSGCSLRIYSSNTPGFSYVNRSELDPKSLVNGAKNAQSFQPENPSRSIANLSIESEPRDQFFDSSIKDDIESRKNRIEQTISRFIDNDIVRTLQVQFQESSKKTTIYHDGEYMQSQWITNFKITVWAVCDDGEDVQSGYEYQSSYQFEDLEPRTVFERAIKKGDRKLGAENPPSHDGALILTESASSSILGLIKRMVNGEAVIKGRSNWNSEKIDSRVGEENVTIIDDPKLANGAANKEIDDEGFPMESLTIVDEGIYKNFLTNSFVAHECELDNNHRSSRDYKQRPSVGSTNFCLEPGDTSKDQLKQELNTGPVVTSIQPGSGMDPVAGFFSVGASGYWIEKGEYKYPFDEATLAGNVDEYLQGILAIGEQRPEGYSVSSPATLAEDLSLGGD